MFVRALCSLCLCGFLSAQEWPYYGGDQGGTKHSPLEQINLKNIEKLKPAWEWRTGEEPLSQYGTSPGTFQTTPLMIGNVLYLSTPYNRVIALDAETGKQLWESILGGNVSVSTISYAVNGKQYIAVMTGDNLKVPELAAEVPELRTPTGHNAIYVFSLP